MLYPDFVEILNEASEMSKKIKAGAMQTAGIASKMAAQFPAFMAGSPTRVVNPWAGPDCPARPGPTKFLAVTARPN